MDFFEEQAKAHRKTKWLVIYFVMAVAAMIAAIYICLMLIFSAAMQTHHHPGNYEEPHQPVSIWNPEVLIGVSVVVLAVVGIGSAYKTSALSAGA